MEVLIFLLGAKDIQTFYTLMEYLIKCRNDYHKTYVILSHTKYMQKGNPDGQKILALANESDLLGLHHNNFIIILK